MTAPADLLPDLDRLAADIAGLAGGPERSMAALLSQAAADLATRGQSLATIADTLDAATADAAATLADLRAKIAALPQPAPAPARKPTGYRSGLPWASTWRHPSATTAIVKPAFESFETYRGRKLDGLHVFMQGYSRATAATWPSRCWPTAKARADGTAEGVLWWLARDRIDAYLTWALFPDQGLPAGKARFQAVLDGAFDACHAAIADQVLASGAAVRVIRIGHEANMGNLATGTGTYPWSVAYAQGDLALYRAAYAHVGNLLQAKFPDALLDFNCLRQLTNVTSLDDIFPGPPFAIISGEGYGNDDTIATPTGLATFMGRGTPDLPMGPASWAAAARKRGCLTSVPEWAPAVPAGKAATRDVGDYVRAMWEHFQIWSPILAFESLFGNDDSQNAGLHSIWNPVSVPLCSAAYQECWKPRWLAP